MCVACTPQGCLSSTRTIADFFGPATHYRTFPADPSFPAKWAATASAICSAGSTLQCANLTPSEKPLPGVNPPPTVLAPPPVGTPESSGPHCISCALDDILIDPQASGIYTIKLSLDIARDGIVTAVQASGAPTPALKLKIEQQAQQWLFAPYLKDGIRVNLHLTTAIRINVVHL